MRIEVVGFEHFLNLPGWSADRLVFSGKDLQVEPHRVRRRSRVCPGCHGAMTPSRSQSQRVRDIGLGPDCPLRLTYTTIQGRCRPGGRYHSEHPPGVDGRSTIRFQRWVSSLCRRVGGGHHSFDRMADG